MSTSIGDIEYFGTEQEQMPRPFLYEDVIIARFPAGTFKRMDHSLEKKEKRADLMRKAVEREIKRRERLAKGNGEQ